MAGDSTCLFMDTLRAAMDRQRNCGMDASLSGIHQQLANLACKATLLHVT